MATETADDLCTPTDCDVTFVKYSDRVAGGGGRGRVATVMHFCHIVSALSHIKIYNISASCNDGHAANLPFRQNRRKTSASRHLHLCECVCVRVLDWPLSRLE